MGKRSVVRRGYWMELRSIAKRLNENRRLWLLVLVFAIYGTFSSSTPDEPGLWEAILGILLILLVGFGGFAAMGGELLALRPAVPPYVVSAFIWLFVAPTIVGVLVRGHNIGDYLRDLIPFLYLMLPVFLARNMKKYPETWRNLIEWGLSFVALAFVLRFYLSVNDQDIWVVTIHGGMDYFIMDPAVIFSATFLLATGLNFWYSARRVVATVTFLSGAFAYSALLAATVRAQIVMVFGAILVVVVLRVSRSPGRFSAWAPLLAVTLSVLAFGDVMQWVSWIAASIASKTDVAGLANMRDVEMLEILRHVSSGWHVLLFGDGWGAKLYLSTSSDEVRFAHNLLLYLLWKTGVLGLVAFSGMFYWIARHLTVIGRRSLRDSRLLPLWFGCFNVLVIHAGLEPGFKMLSFGFVLSAAVAAADVIKTQLDTQRAIGTTRAPVLETAKLRRLVKYRVATK